MSLTYREGRKRRGGFYSKAAVAGGVIRLASIGTAAKWQGCVWRARRLQQGWAACWGAGDDAVASGREDGVAASAEWPLTIASHVPTWLQILKLTIFFFFKRLRYKNMSKPPLTAMTHS